MSTVSGKPKVSVIIPVYNSPDYVGQAVESVLSQTYRDCEIIVVDDGSTDNTRTALEPYLDRIQYVYQDNQGSAAARNRGIRQAKGELIAFLDADDFFILPEKLAAQVACCDAQPSLGSIHTGWRIINQQGETLSEVEPWHKIPELNLETWLRWKPIRTSSIMIRRIWLERAEGFDVQLRQSHDVDLALRLALMGCEAAWLPQVTVCYRLHDRNTMRNALKQAQCVQAVLNKFFSRSDLPERIRQIEPQVRYSTLVWIAWYQYYTGHYPEMVKYLQESFSYTPYSAMETISDWSICFRNFSSDRGYRHDTYSLSNLPEWKQAIRYVLNLTAAV
jgi:glycosyltransferase involved in cell wall biosynthesis